MGKFEEKDGADCVASERGELRQLLSLRTKESFTSRLSTLELELDQLEELRVRNRAI